MTNRSLLSLCALLVVCGCGGQTDTITVGVAGPLGEWAGDMTKKGIDLAIAEINARGGVRGRRLEVKALDDSSSGVRAAAVAQQLVADPAVVGVIGHVTSGAMVAAAQVYDGKLAAVATSATSPELTGISPWVFRVISSDSANGREIARFATARGHKRAAILYENDAYGRGLADAFRRGFAGEIVSMDPITGDLADAEPYIAYYKKLAPDMVFVASRAPAGLQIIREAHRQRLAIDLIGGDGWAGIVADTAQAEGAFVGTPFTAEDPRPEVQKFVADFRARYGVTPDKYSATGYDATMVLAQAIAAVGTDREAIRDYLASLTDETAYHGITGVIRFGADGDPVEAGYRVTRVRHGAFTVVAASK